MNKIYSKAMLVALPFLFYFGYDKSQPHIPAEDPDYTRFHNVTEWEGIIKITFDGTSSKNETTYRVDHEYKLYFVTGEGIKAMADPFGGGSPYGDISEEDLRSGNYDPMELARQVRMNQNAFKQWGAGHGITTPPFETSTSATIRSEMSKSFETHSGEGGSPCTINEIERSTVDGKNENGGILMVINKNSGTYSFMGAVSLNGIEESIKHTFSPDHCGANKFENKSYTKEASGHAYLNEFINEVTIVNQKLPESGLTLTGSGMITDRLKMKVPDSDQEQEVTVHVKWTIYPKGEKQPEYYVELKDKEWIPELDNWVGVELNHQEGAPQKVRFTLFDYSSEPGTYLNSEDDNEDPDLEFDPKMEELGYVIKKEGEIFTATLENPVSGRSTAILLSHDYGAYGKIKAEVYVNGGWQIVRDKGTQKPNVSVPWDDNENHIADHWEEETGILGMNLDANWDEDPYPELQKKPGDRFTLYEEYRGFKAVSHLLNDGKRQIATKNNHFRMDPLHKDVFVYDEHGLFHQYYDPDNPAKLNWHYIKPDMIKEFTPNNPTNSNHRLINFNTSGKFHSGEQYAMHVVNHENQGGLAGAAKHLGDLYVQMDKANETICTQKVNPHPLWCHYAIRIFPDRILSHVKSAPLEANADIQLLYLKLMKSTVAHEVGHGIGIPHHTNPETLEEETESGVKTCYMRYEEVFEKLHPRLITMDHYCKDGEFWFEVIESDGNLDSIPRKKNSSHKCWEQINIKGN